MAEQRKERHVTPGQAQWIVERMLSERRLSRADVRDLLSDMAQEISELEHRLAALKGTAGAPSVSRPARRQRRAAKVGRRQLTSRKKASGHPRGIAGTLAVLLRSIPAAEHAAIATIRAEKGIKAAIIAAKAAAKKA